MYNYQKIQDAVLRDYKFGDDLTYKEIVKIVKSHYDIKESCILPSDLCDNHKNKDPKAGKHHIFHKLHKLGKGKYQVL